MYKIGDRVLLKERLSSALIDYLRISTKKKRLTGTVIALSWTCDDDVKIHFDDSTHELYVNKDDIECKLMGNRLIKEKPVEITFNCEGLGVVRTVYDPISMTTDTISRRVSYEQLLWFDEDDFV